jgi:hypothetical protein
MPAGRPKGAKNKRPRGEEFVKKAALLRASARLKYVVPYDLDKNEKLDPMALLEEVMQHFYRKAKIECRSRQAGQTTFQHSYGRRWKTRFTNGCSVSGSVACCRLRSAKSSHFSARSSRWDLSLELEARAASSNTCAALSRYSSCLLIGLSSPNLCPSQ